MALNKSCVFHPFNNLMNRVADDWTRPIDPLTSEPQGLGKRVIASRLVTVIVGVPSEVLAVAVKALETPIQAVACVLKLPVKILKCLSGNEALQKFDDQLPGLATVLKTAFRVVGYAIGTFFTATLGFLSPRANLALHNFLGLTKDQRAAISSVDFVDVQGQEPDLISVVGDDEVNAPVVGNDVVIEEPVNGNTDEVLDSSIVPTTDVDVTINEDDDFEKIIKAEEVAKSTFENVKNVGKEWLNSGVSLASKAAGTVWDKAKSLNAKLPGSDNENIAF